MLARAAVVAIFILWSHATIAANPCDGFRCDGKCLSKEVKCDGYRDCRSGIDEINCKCRNYHFKCENGPCIFLGWMCDGTKDCPLGDDENDKKCGNCRPDEFKCFTRSYCVNGRKRCDGRSDCMDSSDEANCFYTENGFVKMIHQGRKDFYMCADRSYGVVLSLLCQYFGKGELTHYENSTLKNNENGLSISLYPNQSNLDVYQMRTCTKRLKVKLVCKPSDCGRRASSFESKGAYIINGRRSKVGQWPWVAYLKTRINDTAVKQCSASIVNPRWILSAAHCLKFKNGGFKNPDTNASLYEIVVGRGQMKNFHELKWLSAKKVVFVGYNTDYVFNDVVLFELETTLKFSDSVRSICLADPNKFEREKKTYEVCVSAGFGKKKEEKSSPEPEYFGENYRFHLLYGKMNLLYRFTCSHFPQHLCAGSVFPKGVTTGLGDSGGPLMCRRQNGLWVQVGVASYKVGKTGVGGFSRVSYFYNDIQSVISGQELL